MNEKHKKVFEVLESLKIPYEVHYHPPAPTVEDALKYWKEIDASHCKNLFFRNHKGNKHYLVIFKHLHQLNIKELEQRLHQGKLTFASEERMQKYLGVKPGSVSPFGIINDEQHHVYLFIDKYLEKTEKISFHPNENTATVVIKMNDFIIFLEHFRNRYEFIQLYD